MEHLAGLFLRPMLRVIVMTLNERMSLHRLSNLLGFSCRPNLLVYTELSVTLLSGIEAVKICATLACYSSWWKSTFVLALSYLLHSSYFLPMFELLVLLNISI